MNTQKEELKYRILWWLGTVLSMVIYFSGVFGIYCLLRKKIFGHYRSIVLTYHRINDSGVDPDISVLTEKFEAQMRYLNKKFDVIPANEVALNEDQVEIYANPTDNYIELEAQGAYQEIKPGEIIKWETKWFLKKLKNIKIEIGNLE